MTSPFYGQSPLYAKSLGVVDDAARSYTVPFENSRAVFRVYLIDESGSSLISVPPPKVFNELLVTNITIPAPERYQVVGGSDGNKFYAFGVEHKTLQIAGVIGDANLDRQINPSEWSGRSNRALLNFVKQHASVGACAKNRTIVELSLATQIYYGAVTSLSMSYNALNANAIQVGMSFYVSRELVSAAPTTDES